MYLVEQEPSAQVAGAGQAHQAVDGKVHPEGQERTRERQVGVVRRDEHDRPGGMFLRHPVGDRETLRTALDRVGQEPQDIAVGVEDRADRFRHARRFLGRQRGRNGVFELGVDSLQLGSHEVVRDRRVRGLAVRFQLDADFDE